MKNVPKPPEGTAAPDRENRDLLHLIAADTLEAAAKREAEKCGWR